jgi:hypothetical protein
MKTMDSFDFLITVAAAKKLVLTLIDNVTATIPVLVNRAAKSNPEIPDYCFEAAVYGLLSSCQIRLDRDAHLRRQWVMG